MLHFHIVAYAENCYDGGINASADDVHLSAVGMGRLNVVYAHGDSDDAWGIDQDIEDIFVKCTSDAATYTSVWQQVYSIVKKEHIARHGSSCLDVINSESVRQCTRTVNLNTIVENGNANRGFYVQRTLYKAVYRELNQACVRYFQLDSFVRSLF